MHLGPPGASMARGWSSLDIKSQEPILVAENGGAASLSRDRKFGK
jgi:hypothetical protein